MITMIRSGQLKVKIEEQSFSPFDHQVPSFQNSTIGKPGYGRSLVKKSMLMPTELRCAEPVQQAKSSRIYRRWLHPFSHSSAGLRGRHLAKASDPSLEDCAISHNNYFLSPEPNTKVLEWQLAFKVANGACQLEFQVDQIRIITVSLKLNQQIGVILHTPSSRTGAYQIYDCYLRAFYGTFKT